MAGMENEEVATDREVEIDGILFFQEWVDHGREMAKSGVFESKPTVNSTPTAEPWPPSSASAPNRDGE